MALQQACRHLSGSWEQFVAKAKQLYAAGPGSSYPWAIASRGLADTAGNCSLVQTVNDSYAQNHASVAGGAMFSSDYHMTSVLCLPDSVPPASERQAGCSMPAWEGNTAGYGHNIAYPPSQLLVTSQDFLSYVSNGLDTLPMVVRAHDQAGADVIVGMHASSPPQLQQSVLT